MNRVLTLISRIIYGIGILLILAFAGVRLLGLQPYVVTSTSMIPDYPVGAMIYTKAVEPEELEIGDSITYTLDDRVTTHQIYNIDREAGLYYTRGINNRGSGGILIPDGSPVTEEDILGKVLFSLPYLGYVNRFCTTGPGCYIILMFLVAYMSGVWLVQNYMEKDGEIRIQVKSPNTFSD